MKYIHLMSLTLCAVLLAGCGGESLAPKELLERARYLSDTQHAAEAITLFDRLAVLEPNNAELYYLRGLAKERTDNAKGAIDDYTHAVSLKKSYSEAYNNRAVLLAKQGEFQAAADDFSRVLSVSPQFTLGYKNRGLALHDLGHYEQAIADYDRAIELEPDSQGFFLRGNLRLEQKQYELAVADYDAALKLDVENGRAWLNRGMALAHMKDMLAAKESLRRAATLDSSIIAADVLDALQEVGSATGVGLKFSVEKVQQALSKDGWQVAVDDNELLPFKITRNEETRRLCVVLLDTASETLRVTVESSRTLLAETSPMSLLVFVPDQTDAKDNWRFVEDWHPTDSDVSIATVDISVKKK